MKLHVLISTMNQTNQSILKEMNIKTDAILINQTDNEAVYEYNYNNNNILWINSLTRGLSVSRNLALNMATHDICLIADDDLVYYDDYEQSIIQSFLKYPTYDILVFQVEGIEKKFKDYSSNVKELNKLSAMKVSSVEIAFRLKSINEKGIRFNELFGSGAKYQMGEESIFLSHCLNEGLRIKYIPIKIASLHIGNSTWFKGYNERYFESKGAQFAAMSKVMALVYIFQFAIRKYYLYKKEQTVIKSLKLMLRGRKDYLQNGL